jgi:carbamoyl-phosphate synthase / aspartate carbamoyltransferase
MAPVRPVLARIPSVSGSFHAPPVAAASVRDDEGAHLVGVLELVDASAFQGFSFGAEGKSVSGECVFQTGKSRACL